MKGWPAIDSDLAPLFDALHCPHCENPLIKREGGVTCSEGHSWALEDGYLNLAPEAPDPVVAATLRSFGYEWNAFSEVDPADEAFWFEYFAGVDLPELSGKLALDAGCGMGRYSRLTAPYVGSLIALDGSDAVRAAAKTLRSVPNVLVVRADIRSVPIRDGSFGFIQCLGVLHHLPDPQVGFASLVRLLAPGGTLLLYLYSTPAGRGLRSMALAAATQLRKLTVRLPHPVLRRLSAPIALVLYCGFVIPGYLGERVGIQRLAKLPLIAYRGRPLRSLWLDTFDRLSAPTEYRYRWVEVAPWFSSNSLVVRSVDERFGLTIVAEKPHR